MQVLLHNIIEVLLKKLKLSHYEPRMRLGGEV
jgi:hypothetical protein